MPLEAPQTRPEGYPTLEALIIDINNHAKRQGYALFKRQTVKKAGILRYCYLQCDRGGQNRPSQSRGLRISTTRKIDCGFKARATLRLDDQQWHLEILEDQHNHGASPDPVAHPAHRKLTDEQKIEIHQLSRTTTSSTRDITSLLQDQYPEQPFKRKDIENEAIRARKEALGGYTPTQALVRLLQDRGTTYFLRQTQGHISRLFWTFPWCEEIWVKHLQMDNTFKTNHFKMFFINIIRVSNMSSTYNIAFSFINSVKNSLFRLFYIPKVVKL